MEFGKGWGFVEAGAVELVCLVFGCLLLSLAAADDEVDKRGKDEEGDYDCGDRNAGDRAFAQSLVLGHELRFFAGAVDGDDFLGLGAVGVDDLREGEVLALVVGDDVGVLQEGAAEGDLGFVDGLAEGKGARGFDIEEGAGGEVEAAVGHDDVDGAAAKCGLP